MTNQVTLAVGNIVRLKSGGPQMTVQTKPEPPGKFCNCQWFVGMKLESGIFPADSLELVTAEKQ